MPEPTDYDMLHWLLDRMSDGNRLSIDVMREGVWAAHEHLADGESETLGMGATPEAAIRNAMEIENARGEE